MPTIVKYLSSNHTLLKTQLCGKAESKGTSAHPRNNM